jgi:hypothetical protein
LLMADGCKLTSDLLKNSSQLRAVSHQPEFVRLSQATRF